MSKLLEDISSMVLSEKEDERSSDLSQDGKKANKEISQMGFSLIKDMINKGDELTNTDVNDYLDKADGINNEVDTVVFGLETDDNEIVKVYVACPDADAFEQAMAERLGTEDDLEDVIAELAQEYDIVDVEWPDSDEKEEEGDEEEEEPETQNSAGEESSEAETELNFDKPVVAKEQMEDNMTTLGERFKARIISSTLVEAKEERQWPTEIDEFAKTLTTPAQEAILYLITLFGLPREVLASRKSISEFRHNLYKASKEYAKNQTLKIWINKLTKELDNSGRKEDEEDGKKKDVKEALKPESEKEKDDLSPDWDDPKLLKAAKFRDSLPHGVPRLIFDVLLSLGVPHGMLTDINKSKVRNSIRELSFKIRRTQRLRIYLNLIADAFGVKADDQTESAIHSKIVTTVKEAKLEQDPEQQDYITIVKELLGKLGIPAANLQYKTSFVTRALKARKMQLNYASLIPKLELFLSYVANAERVKNEAPITEAALDKEQNYDTLVRDIATALGFPPENLAYKESMLTQALRQRKSTLNWSSLISKMKKLLQQIQSLDTKQESIKDLTAKTLTELVTTRMKKDDEEETDVDKILGKGGPKEKEDDTSVDVGKWNFASLGSVGLTMRARGVKLQFEDIVAERIAKMLGDGKSATAKTVDGDKVVFTPKDRGRSYVIKGIPKFETGVRVSNKDIDNLLDALGTV